MTSRSPIWPRVHKLTCVAIEREARTRTASEPGIVAIPGALTTVTAGRDDPARSLT